MSTITVPLTPELDLFIKEELKETFSSKAELVRQALQFYRTELAVRRIMQAKREPSLAGNLKDLIKQIN